MAKVLCVLYDDPVTGYPKSYARDGLPKIERYPDGQTLPAPDGIDFTPGTLLGSVSGELGLRKYLESNGHQYVVTSSKEGPNSVLDRELPDADIVMVAESALELAQQGAQVLRQDCGGGHDGRHPIQLNYKVYLFRLAGLANPHAPVKALRR